MRESALSQEEISRERVVALRTDRIKGMFPSLTQKLEAYPVSECTFRKAQLHHMLTFLYLYYTSITALIVFKQWRHITSRIQRLSQAKNTDENCFLTTSQQLCEVLCSNLQPGKLGSRCTPYMYEKSPKEATGFKTQLSPHLQKLHSAASVWLLCLFSKLTPCLTLSLHLPSRRTFEIYFLLLACCIFNVWLKEQRKVNPRQDRFIPPRAVVKPSSSSANINVLKFYLCQGTSAGIGITAKVRAMVWPFIWWHKRPPPPINH